MIIMAQNKECEDLYKRLNISSKSASCTDCGKYSNKPRSDSPCKCDQQPLSTTTPDQKPIEKVNVLPVPENTRDQGQSAPPSSAQGNSKEEQKQSFWQWVLSLLGLSKANVDTTEEQERKRKADNVTFATQEQTVKVTFTKPEEPVAKPPQEVKKQEKTETQSSSQLIEKVEESAEESSPEANPPKKSKAKQKKKRFRSKSPNTKSRNQYLGRSLDPYEYRSSTGTKTKGSKEKEAPPPEKEPVPNQSPPKPKRLPISENSSSAKYLIAYSPSHQLEVGCGFELNLTTAEKQSMSCPPPCCSMCPCAACPPPPCICGCCPPPRPPCFEKSVTSLMRSRCPSPVSEQKKCSGQMKSKSQKGQGSYRKRDDESCPPCPCCQPICPCPPSCCPCPPPPPPPPRAKGPTPCPSSVPPPCPKCPPPCSPCPPPCPPPCSPSCPACPPPCPVCPPPCPCPVCPPPDPCPLCPPPCPICMPPCKSKPTSKSPSRVRGKSCKRTISHPSSSGPVSFSSTGKHRSNLSPLNRKKQCGSRQPVKGTPCTTSTGRPGIIPERERCGGCPITCLRACCVPLQAMNDSCPSKKPCCPASGVGGQNYHSRCGYSTKGRSLPVSTYCNPSAIRSYEKSRGNDALCKFLLTKYNIPIPEYCPMMPMTMQSCPNEYPYPQVVRDLQYKPCKGGATGSCQALKTDTKTCGSRQFSFVEQRTTCNCPGQQGGAVVTQSKDKKKQNVEGNKTQNYYQTTVPDNAEVNNTPVVFNKYPCKTQPHVSIALSKRTQVECLRERGPRSPTKEFISKVGLPNKKTSPRKSMEENAEPEEGSSDTKPPAKERSLNKSKAQAASPADDIASRNVSDNKARSERKTEGQKSKNGTTSDTIDKTKTPSARRPKLKACTPSKPTWPASAMNRDRYSIKNSSFYRNFLTLTPASNTRDSDPPSTFFDDCESVSQNEEAANSASSNNQVDLSDQPTLDTTGCSHKVNFLPSLCEVDSIESSSMMVSNQTQGQKCDTLSNCPAVDHKIHAEPLQSTSLDRLSTTMISQAHPSENTATDCDDSKTNDVFLSQSPCRAPRKDVFGQTSSSRNYQRVDKVRQRSRSVSPGQSRREKVMGRLAQDSRSRSRSPSTRHRSISPQHRTRTPLNKQSVTEVNDKDSVFPQPKLDSIEMVEEKKTEKTMQSQSATVDKNVGNTDEAVASTSDNKRILSNDEERLIEQLLASGMMEAVSESMSFTCPNEEVSELTARCDQTFAAASWGEDGCKSVIDEKKNALIHNDGEKKNIALDATNSEQTIHASSNKLVSTHPTLPTTNNNPNQFACLSDCRPQGESSVDPQEYETRRAESCVDPSYCSSAGKLASLHSRAGSCVDFIQPSPQSQHKLPPSGEPDIYTNKPLHRIVSSLDETKRPSSYLKQDDDTKGTNNSNCGGDVVDNEQANNSNCGGDVDNEHANNSNCVEDKPDYEEANNSNNGGDLEAENDTSKPEIVETPVVSEHPNEAVAAVVQECTGDDSVLSKEMDSLSVNEVNQQTVSETSNFEIKVEVQTQNVTESLPEDPNCDIEDYEERQDCSNNPTLGRITQPSKLHELLKNSGVKWQKVGPATPTDIKIFQLAKNAYKGVQNLSNKDGAETAEGEGEEAAGKDEGRISPKAFMELLKPVDQHGECRPLSEELIKPEGALEDGSILSRLKDF